MSNYVIIRNFGLQYYEIISTAMHNFTNKRLVDSADEIWMVQHPHIFTQGQTGKADNNVLLPNHITVVQSYRGGKITFHGPGQQIMYFMLDLRRIKLKVRNLVSILEHTVINTLKKFNIYAYSNAGAPGVYVGDNKICSIGLRICKGCSLYGLALNVSMDLSPFLCINPCGYPGLRMTQMIDFSPNIKIDNVVPVLISEFLALINYYCNIQYLYFNN